VVSANPGMVSLNDQATVANLLVGDLCKVCWVASCVSKALLATSYVRRHTRLLAAYTAAKDLFNRHQPPGAAAENQTAVDYPKPATWVLPPPLRAAGGREYTGCRRCGARRGLPQNALPPPPDADMVAGGRSASTGAPQKVPRTTRSPAAVSTAPPPTASATTPATSASKTFSPSSLP